MSGRRSPQGTFRAQQIVEGSDWSDKLRQGVKSSQNLLQRMGIKMPQRSVRAGRREEQPQPSGAAAAGCQGVASRRRLARLRPHPS